MKTTYLDYYKMILEKVSFNPLLFAKEYLKAVDNLNADDARKLENWLEMKGLKRMKVDRKYTLEKGMSNDVSAKHSVAKSASA